MPNCQHPPTMHYVDPSGERYCRQCGTSLDFPPVRNVNLPPVPEDREGRDKLIVELRAEGWTQVEIGVYVGCSDGAVSMVLKRAAMRRK